MKASTPRGGDAHSRSFALRRQAEAQRDAEVVEQPPGLGGLIAQGGDQTGHRLAVPGPEGRPLDGRHRLIVDRPREAKGHGAAR
ncbi:hypothetical protein [Actinoplanes aureus]|uniref:Uncharacterized protein n=1 Tax=Actinoplanes aureus TaxID=2792083 RepID=A0A931C6L3_9ACTN|nr:hypothetical protein [Actinoplanes aureus]MBG0564354.1 hypothetical protein [Actinoplanes aureus]